MVWSRVNKGQHSTCSPFLKRYLVKLRMRLTEGHVVAQTVPSRMP